MTFQKSFTFIVLSMCSNFIAAASTVTSIRNNNYGRSALSKFSFFSTSPKPCSELSSAVSQRDHSFKTCMTGGKDRSIRNFHLCSSSCCRYVHLGIYMSSSHTNTWNRESSTNARSLFVLDTQRVSFQHRSIDIHTAYK